MPQLLVPDGQVLVGHLACDVKHKHAGVRLVVVGRVHAVEPLLACRVPEVYMGMGGGGGEGRGGRGREVEMGLNSV